MQRSQVDLLRRFHRDHFPGRPPPLINVTNLPASSSAEWQQQREEEVEEDEEGHLGYYDDGVRRTLSDAQIAMFRHSEIQRLMLQRRIELETKEEQQAATKDHSPARVSRIRSSSEHEKQDLKGARGDGCWVHASLGNGETNRKERAHTVIDRAMD